jgi:hypothetical protein
MRDRAPAAVRETLVGQRVFSISICVLALFFACFGPFWTSTVRSAHAVRRLIERYEANQRNVALVISIKVSKLAAIPGTPAEDKNC